MWTDDLRYALDRAAQYAAIGDRTMARAMEASAAAVRAKIATAKTGRLRPVLLSSADKR